MAFPFPSSRFDEWRVRLGRRAALRSSPSEPAARLERPSRSVRGSFQRLTCALAEQPHGPGCRARTEGGTQPQRTRGPHAVSRGLFAWNLECQTFDQAHSRADIRVTVLSARRRLSIQTATPLCTAPASLRSRVFQPIAHSRVLCSSQSRVQPGAIACVAAGVVVTK